MVLGARLSEQEVCHRFFKGFRIIRRDSVARTGALHEVPVGKEAEHPMSHLGGEDIAFAAAHDQGETGDFGELLVAGKSA